MNSFAHSSTRFAVVHQFYALPVPLLRQVYLDPSGLNSLSSDMLTFTKISENKDSGLTFSRVFIDIFLPDMRFSRGFINTWPLEFLGFGSLGYPLDPFGVTVAVLAPLGYYFGWLLHRARSLWPQKQSRRWWIQDVGSVFVSFWRYSVSLDNGSTDVSLWFWKIFLWLCLWLFQWLCIRVIISVFSS